MLIITNTANLTNKSYKFSVIFTRQNLILHLKINISDCKNSIIHQNYLNLIFNLHNNRLIRRIENLNVCHFHCLTINLIFQVKLSNIHIYKI